MKKIVFIIHFLIRLFPKNYKLGKKNIVLFVCFIFNYTLLSGQSFPVQVIPQATPPPPIYLSNYADASTTNSPLRVQIVLNDLTISNREIRLKTYFEGNDIAFESNNIVAGATPLFLEGGIPLTLTNVELAPYFEFQNITGISPTVYGQAIPEGSYQFCFEVYDVLSGNRLSNKSCATSIVFQNEPPFLVAPRNKTNIDEVNPQNIVFQWTPRHINVSNVEYELSIVEIWDNNVDPQQAFLSSPPVFQTTTTATIYVYGPADPLLLSGKNYVWRVQAKAKRGIEEVGLFKNQGYSEIYSFSYAFSCDLPLGINHEVKGSTNANIFWDDFSTDIPEYTLRYRQKNVENAEWFTSKTTTNSITLWDLKEGTTYEYQLQKKCVVTQSDWSFTKEFTTILEFEEESVLDCGISPDINLENMEPLSSIQKGDAFEAGDFPVKILEVSGSNGRFTGRGYVTLPYLKNIKVAVEFTNVLINTDKKLAEGSIRTVYDASWGNILDTADITDVADDISDVFTGGDKNIPITVPFEIPSKENIKIEDGKIVITGPNGETKTFDHDQGDSYQITDKEGNSYHIDEDGNITEGEKGAQGGAATAENTNGISGGSGTVTNPSVNAITATDITVSFTTSNKTIYDLDLVTSDFEKANYAKVTMPNGDHFYPPHKAVVEGKTDEFLAVIENKNPEISLDSIIVKTVKGTQIKNARNGNTFTITIAGKNSYHNEEAVITYKAKDGKYKTIASFFIHHIKQQDPVEVVVISVNGTSTLNNLQQELNGIFNKAGATFNVKSGNALSITQADWDTNNNGVLDYETNGLLSNAKNYPPELKKIHKKYKDQNPNYNPKAYHLFVLNDSIKANKPLNGFMPKTRQWGYLFNAYIGNNAIGKKDDLNLVAAHELGHGVFRLQHPFEDDENASGSGTNWLMDYTGGKELSYADWALMSDESLNIGLFQDREDAEIAGKIWFTPNWKPFTVANTSTINSSKVTNVPNGAIPGFKLNNKIYTAEFEDNKFIGYFNKYNKGKNNNDEYKPNKITALDSDADVYLYLYDGGCRNSKYYKTKYYYVNKINSERKSFDFKNDKNIEFVSKLACEQKTNYSVCDNYTALDLNNEDHRLLKNEYQKSLNTALENAINEIDNSKGTLYRDKKNIVHVQFANKSSDDAIDDADLQRLEDKLHLLSYYKKDVYMVVTFLKTQNNLSVGDSIINNMASKAIANLSNATDKKIVNVVIPYADYQSILRTHNQGCYNIGFAQSDESILTIKTVSDKKSIRDDIISVFENIEKPLYIKQYFTKADGSFVIVQQEAKDLRGFSEIHLLEFWNSKYIREIESIRNKIIGSIQSYSQNETPTYNQSIKFLNQQSDYNNQIKEKYDLAQIDEIDIDVYSQNNTWEHFRPTNISLLREVYVFDVDISNSYYASQISSYGFIKVVDVYAGFNKDLNSDIHFYDFDGYKLADPLVYGAADVLSMVPVFYIDNIGDGIGFLYGTYRGDTSQTPFYAIGLAMPIGAAYLKKGAKSIDDLYVIVAKQADDGNITFNTVLRRNIKPNDIQITSVLSSKADDANAALKEITQSKVYKENAEKYVRGFISKKEKLLALIDNADEGIKKALKADLNASDELVEAFIKNPELLEGWKYINNLKTKASKLAQDVGALKIITKQISDTDLISKIGKENYDNILKKYAGTCKGCKESTEEIIKHLPSHDIMLKNLEEFANIHAKTPGFYKVIEDLSGEVRKQKGAEFVSRILKGEKNVSAFEVEYLDELNNTVDFILSGKFIDGKSWGVKSIKGIGGFKFPKQLKDYFKSGKEFEHWYDYTRFKQSSDATYNVMSKEEAVEHIKKQYQKLFQKPEKAKELRDYLGKDLFNEKFEVQDIDDFIDNVVSKLDNKLYDFIIVR